MVFCGREFRRPGVVYCDRDLRRLGEVYCYSDFKRPGVVFCDRETLSRPVSTTVNVANIQIHNGKYC